jgi:MFS family permease
MGSLIAASFSTKVWHLILTQGLLYGIGFLVLYYALLSMLNEWFVERRGLAYGILFAAAGLSGSGLPFLLEIVLNKYGYAVTLRGYAVAVLVLIGPTLPFCVGRIPYSDQVQTSRKVAFKSVLTNPIFHILSISNLFQGLAFYLPGLYLSLYAETLHISPIRSTLLICLLNLAQVVGQIALGWLSDCSDIFTLLLVSTVGSAIPCCVLWYTATEIKHLIAFSVVYGIFAGGYSVFYPRFVTILTSDPATGLWLYGLLAFGRGVGNVVAGPLSAEILGFMDGKSAHPDQAASYRYLIIYVGAAFLISAFGALGYFWRDRTLTPNRPDCIIRLRQRRKPSQASSHMNFTT